jgi:hypothetical protein
MKKIVGVIAVTFVGVAWATLPPPTPEAKAKAAEAAAKAAWEDKVGLYKLCVAMDKTADAYRQNLKTAGGTIPAPQSTQQCVDPGPYIAQVTPSTSKPLEAAGAHSPPGIAATPPSRPEPAAVVSPATGAKGG